MDDPTHRSVFKRGRLFQSKACILSSYICVELSTNFIAHCNLLLQVWFGSFFMSVGFLMPYFNVLLAHFGYKAWHIGIISALRPMVSTVSGPVLSGVADRLAAHREVFLTTLVLSVAVCSKVAIPPTHISFAVMAALLIPCYNAGSR
jgi:hypothetical protein